MPKLAFDSKEMLRESFEVTLTDFRVLSKDTAEVAAMAGKEYEPDDWKAYVTFKINHSLPVISGPLYGSGNLTGYHPQVIAKSYASLLHQQVNLGHLIKRYDPKNIARDRIIGCVAGVQFPQGSWNQIPDSIQSAPCITCVASIFKQAEGVPKLLGEHLSNREPQSVSIETVFPLSEIAIYLRKQKKMVPIMEADDEMWQGIKRNPKTGKIEFRDYQGEQMVVCPGGANGKVSYQGVGVTPNPAEPTAEILDVRAMIDTLDLKDGLMAVAASAIPTYMFKGGVTWRDGKGATTHARVVKVHTSGRIELGLDRREASPENPILLTETSSGMRVLRSLKSVQV